MSLRNVTNNTIGTIAIVSCSCGLIETAPYFYQFYCTPGKYNIILLSNIDDNI